MGVLRSDRVSGLGGANAINGSVFFSAAGGSDAGGPYLTTPHSDDFAFGSGDFTIEFWIRKQNGSRRVPILAQQAPDGSSDDYACWIEMNADNTIEFQDQTTGAFASTGTISEDTWTHVALVRDGNTLRWFIGGVASGTDSESGSMKDSAYPLSIGKWGEYHNSHATNIFYFEGFLSNLRIQKGKAEYTSAFTPPTTRLEVTPETVLLCCQSPGNAEQEATGKILQAVAPTNGSPPKASRFVPDVGEDYGTTFADGAVFDTLSYMVPPGGTTAQRGRGRGLLMGGAVSPGATNTTQIKYFDIASQGITDDFGQTTVARRSTGSLSSSTRGLMGGGFVAPTSPAHTVSDVIDYVTIATTANAVDFGNMQSTGYSYGTASNETRGLFAGGYRPNNSAVVKTTDLITIASAGNATNFGDLVVARRSFGGLASPTRGIFFGGAPSTKEEIDYVTIATEATALDFGNLTDGRDNVYGGSSSTRGVMGGGRTPSNTNIIDYITIATTGTVTDFGDLLSATFYNAATSNSSRLVWVGNTGITNTMEYVTIATTGNSIDWGDQGGTTQHSGGGCSDSHGGIS